MNSTNGSEPTDGCLARNVPAAGTFASESKNTPFGTTSIGQLNPSRLIRSRSSTFNA
jgi:hypothetical protein